MAKYGVNQMRLPAIIYRRAAQDRQAIRAHQEVPMYKYYDDLLVFCQVDIAMLAMPSRPTENLLSSNKELLDRKQIAVGPIRPEVAWS